LIYKVGLKDGKPGGIYCDRLTISTCLKVLIIKGFRWSSRNCIVKVLEPTPFIGLERVLAFLMRFVGYDVEEVAFFAGHLRTLDGESVHIAGRRLARDMAFKIAETMVCGQPFWGRLNKKWGRNAILLHLAKTIRQACEDISIPVLVVDALARKEGESEPYLIIRRPLELNPRRLKDFQPEVRVHFCRSISKVSDYPLIKPLRMKVSRLVKMLRKKRTSSKPVPPNAALPRLTMRSDKSFALEPASLLIIQEDQISMDRSYRTQPHWLFSSQGRPNFRTLVLENTNLHSPDLDNLALEELGVILIPEPTISLIKPSSSTRHLFNELRRDLWRCFFRIPLSFSSESACTLMRLGLLLRRARAISLLCQKMNVKAFMTCDPYRKDADAMQLVANALGIKTFCFQYSNLNFETVGTVNSADTMFVFSNIYRECFERNGMGPKSFKSIGYVFDSAFPLVQSKASEHRRRLKKNGANFIVCYFDESVQTDKYGCIHPEDHRNELKLLLKKVINEKEFGLIVKVQFFANSVKNDQALDDLVIRARNTGRYLELFHGHHRNIVFPAEAALASDMAIGLSVGGTASLEAAMAGVRSIILNPYGVNWLQTDVYEQCDIVYPTMDIALEAIDGYRKGRPEYADMGDWSPIASYFDPYQDNKASLRIRQSLEEVFTPDSLRKHRHACQ